MFGQYSRLDMDKLQVHVRMNSEKSPRIFIGLLETAGYFSSLNKGFGTLGIQSFFVNLYSDDFQYTQCKGNSIIYFARYVYKKYRYGHSMKPLWFVVLFFCISILFLWSIYKYDTFIFSQGSSFYLNYDLPVLKFLRKKVIFVFLGSEARPPYLSGKVVVEAKLRTRKRDFFDYLFFCTKKKKKQIRFIEKYADAIISHPAYAHFQEKPFYGHLFIGFPFKRETVGAEQLKNNLAKILHVPSTPYSKGTKEIGEMMNTLRSNGYRFEFIQIIGRPNKEVLEEIKTCDFVIDELYSDTPLGGLGTEAAFYGKPAVNGGYYSETIKHDYPEGFIPPIYYCMPEEVESEIERLLISSEECLRAGRTVQAFVEHNWVAEKVADRFMQIIEGLAPRQWLYNPQSITYLYGYGIMKDRLRGMLKEYMQRFGISALRLNDKVALENKFVRFAREEC